MNSKLVIHIVGAESSQEHCMSELHKKIGGAKLAFSYKKFINIDYDEIESHCINWIQDQVNDNELIITYGLPCKATRIWIRKAYPKTKFKYLVWEVHHDKASEERILKERSWTLLFNGILAQGRRAIKHGIPTTHDLIKTTPLRLAMEFEKKNHHDVNSLIYAFTKQQRINGKGHVVPDLICSEAFDVSLRTNCINKISKLVSSLHPAYEAS